MVIVFQPKMSAARVNIIDKAFAKLDRTGDGVVTLEDLNGVYEPTMHPKFKSGEWSKKRVSVTKNYCIF